MHPGDVPPAHYGAPAGTPYGAPQTEPPPPPPPLDIGFPSKTEIIGFIALAAPFVVSMSSSSMSSSNGHVVEYVYRDWGAVFGGIVALVCGVFTAIRLPSTVLRRGARTVAMLALLGGGGVHIARGFGAIGAPEPTSGHFAGGDRGRDPDMDRMMRASAANLEKSNNDLAQKMVEASLQKLVAKMVAGDPARVLWDAAEPELQKKMSVNTLRVSLMTGTEIAGALKGVDEPITYEFAPDNVKAQGKLRYERGAVDFSFRFDRKGEQLLALTYTLPDSMKRKPDLGEASTVARSALDAFIHGDMQAMQRWCAGGLLDELEEKKADLEAFVAKLKGANKLAETHAGPCESDKDHHCVDFAFQVGRDKAVGSAELVHNDYRWVVLSLNANFK